jgi:hypothetical protein
MKKDDDKQFLEYLLASVEDGCDRWDLELEGGWYFCIPKKRGIIPKVGQRVRLYGKGVGYSVRGVDIEEKTVFYMTEEEADEKHRKYCKKQEALRKRNFKKAKAGLDARFDKLPPVFQERMQKLRDKDPKFRFEYESYEMFAYEQAVIIADTLKTPKAVEEFWKSNGKWVKVPQLSEGHSPNSLGCACALAKLYLENPEAVANVRW